MPLNLACICNLRLIATIVYQLVHKLEIQTLKLGQDYISNRF